MSRRHSSKRIFRRDRRPMLAHQIGLGIAVMAIALTLAMCQTDPPSWSLVYLSDSDPAVVRAAGLAVPAEPGRRTMRFPASAGTPPAAVYLTSRR